MFTLPVILLFVVCLVTAAALGFVVAKKGSIDFHLPDARGWIGIGTFLLTIMVLWMVKGDETLRKDEFFKVLATLIVGAYIKDVVGWAYSSTKQGGELADKNADIVTQNAANSLGTGTGEPPKVQIEQPPKAPPLRTTDVPADAAPEPEEAEDEEDTRDLTDPNLTPVDEEDAFALVQRARATGDAATIANVSRAVQNWRSAPRT